MFTGQFMLLSLSTIILINFPRIVIPTIPFWLSGFPEQFSMVMLLLTEEFIITTVSAYFVSFTSFPVSAMSGVSFQ